ncbi:MAG: DUF560 domain-containing protein [candidate division Zixibacteria bacterium]|nr:DUF560 domain-containing protein [candidate division Zixibacteria bacterium]
MKRSIRNVLLVVFVLMASSLNAEVVTEATIGSGYQGNLFNDSNSTSDSYASIGMGLKYYPLASTQFSAGAQYNAFTSYSDLSNLSGHLSAIFIPTPEASPFSIALVGDLGVRRFGKLYELYDQVEATVGADLGYRVTPWAYLQSSVTYFENNYSNSDFGSSRGFSLVMLVNLTVLKTNALSLKADYSHRSFDQPTLTQEGSVNTQANGQDKSEAFDITGIVLQYSRPLGERTGLNLSIGHRQLHVNNDYTVLGYTIDYLSPWSDLWEGMSFSGGLKHIFHRQITTELSFAYYDKNYVDVMELADTDSETYWRDTRDDKLTTMSLSISKSISIQNGKQLTPVIYVGYRKNQSTTSFFDYEDILASISLKMGF